MSLLGFDALGRFALGQLPGGRTTISLPAAAGSFALAGQAATFTIKEAADAGSFALAGVSGSFTVKEAVGAGTFAFTGVAAAFKITELALSGAFVLTGNPANDQTTEDADPGVFTLTGNDAPLIRSGADFELVYGGVGHYLEEMERARQLAKITRKTPAPIDRRTMPRFEPLPGPPIAPPAVDMAAIQNERMAAQAAAAAAAKKRRRDEEAVLLLAS
jgi:hypothetical protein